MADELQERPVWASALLAAMAVLMVIYGIDVLFHPLPPAVSDLLQKFASAFGFFGAAALCVMKGRRCPGERSAWRLMALAMVLWGLGAVAFAAYVWGVEDAPYPSIADGLWIAFYVPAFGALLLLRRRAGKVGRGVWLDASVTALGIVGGAAVLWFGIFLEGAVGSPAAIVTNLAFPIGDLGLLAFVTGALMIFGWKGAGDWRWIALAFGTYAVSDSLYLVEIAQESYVSGNLLDLGWPFAALLIGVAAWSSPGSRALLRTAPRGRRP